MNEAYATNYGALAQGGTAFVSDIIESGEGYASGPERLLLSALLFDGVQSYMNYFAADSDESKSKYREAYLWVHRTGSDYVFSFDAVCEALGVNPEYLRYGLINACNSQSFEWRRSRRNF